MAMGQNPPPPVNIPIPTKIGAISLILVSGCHRVHQPLPEEQSTTLPSVRHARKNSQAIKLNGKRLQDGMQRPTHLTHPQEDTSLTKNSHTERPKGDWSIHALQAKGYSSSNVLQTSRLTTAPSFSHSLRAKPGNISSAAVQLRQTVHQS